MRWILCLCATRHHQFIHSSWFFRIVSMVSAIAGCFFGLREFCCIPMSLWRLHKQIEKATTLTHQCSVNYSSTLLGCDNVLFEQKGNRSSASQETDASIRSTMESMKPTSSPHSSNNIFILLARIWLINVLLVLASCVSIKSIWFTETFE